MSPFFRLNNSCLLFNTTYFVFFLFITVAAINLVCYFTSWSQYWKSPGRFVTDDIEPDFCTHIIYAYAKISGNQITKYEWNDDGTYNSLRELKTR